MINVEVYRSDVNRAFSRLAAFLLLALGLLSQATGQRLSSAMLSGGQDLDSGLSAALRTPGSLQSRLRFEHLTSADGLSSESVFSILQDRRGFMWFGTQGGLNRYDGRQSLQSARTGAAFFG
jgi:hypothetical protein